MTRGLALNAQQEQPPVVDGAEHQSECATTGDHAVRYDKLLKFARNILRVPALCVTRTFKIYRLVSRNRHICPLDLKWDCREGVSQHGRGIKICGYGITS